MPTAPHVLIVDDEPHVAELIHDAFAVEGLGSRTAADAREALALLDEATFDVMLVDVHMPGASGLDLLARARGLTPAPRVILMSGVTDTSSLAQALSLGAYDFFPKPLDLPRLITTVREAGGQARSPQLPLRAARAMQLEAQVSRASLESIAALVQAVEAKDPYTRRHSEQVAHYATGLARRLELPPRRVEVIRTAALLHDIGKIGVPDHVLTKPGPLTDAEAAQVRRHPALGAEILRKITALSHESRLVRCHHERWDGEGYPDGVAGEDVPLGGRVIHVADAMDAMLMARTYKDPYPLAKMLEELSACAGTQFDPHLSGVAIQWCLEDRTAIILPEAA